MADSNPLAHSPTLTATAPGGDTRQLDAGTKVGDYVVERVIGAGAMGEVYAGKHPVIGKRVAIKVLRHELAASPEAAERFIREARAVNQIDHENVIDVFAFGRLDDGRLYLVMDLVEGKSLRAHLINGPLPLDRALAILGTIADALDAAHDKGVVHRDLKPDNIVIAETGKLFVLDFGIAKLVSKANEADVKPGTLTGQGTWLGTPAYMAPEQWSVDGAGPASDRYALAVIAYELLAGAPPFSAKSVPAMMEQHFRAEVPKLDDVPSALNDVLERGLAKEPDDRYPKARAFVDALRNAAGTNVQRARGAVSPPSGNHKLMMPAVVGSSVLGVALVVVLTTRDRETKPHRPAPAVVAGHAVSITTTPSDAEVRTDHVLGVTPFTLELADGRPLAVTLAKPGYLAKQVSIEQSAHFDLDVVTQFQGVWRMETGELRAFERRDDEVTVFKLREVAGEREFFKNYKFTAAQQGVVFASDDEVIDQRAPNDPRCHVPVRVEYHYDPAGDVLEQKRDKVSIDFVHGSCVVRSRVAETTPLVRVDAAHETVEISAPAGNFGTTKTAKKKVLAVDPTPSKSAQNVTKKPTATYNDPGEMAGKQAPIDTNAQIAPQPNAPPPSQVLDVPQQAMPQKQQQAAPNVRK
jgi:serine/threonine-protein kinase